MTDKNDADEPVISRYEIRAKNCADCSVQVVFNGERVYTPEPPDPCPCRGRRPDCFESALEATFQTGETTDYWSGNSPVAGTMIRAGVSYILCAKCMRNEIMGRAEKFREKRIAEATASGEPVPPTRKQALASLLSKVLGVGDVSVMEIPLPPPGKSDTSGS